MEAQKLAPGSAIVHYSDQELQMFKEDVKMPIMLCSSNHQVSTLCIDTQCTADTCFYCESEQCQRCQKEHNDCYSNVRLDKFVSLVQNQTRNYRLFLIELLQQESQLIQRIKRESMEMIERLRWMGLTGQYEEIIHKIFTARESKVELKSKEAANLLKKLRGVGEISKQKETKLISQFKEETQKVGDHLKNMKKALILNYYSKEEGSSKIEKKQQRIRQESSVPRRSFRNDETLIDSIRSNSSILKNTNDIQFILEALNQPIALKLLFVASHNSFSAQQFHKSCDGIPNTITIVKTIFGKTIAGFTPIKWSSPIYSTWLPDPSKESFLLSLNLKEKMTLVDSEKAIQCSANWGPCFGGGCDIAIADKCDSKDSSSVFPTSYNCHGKYKNEPQTWTLFTGATHFWNFKVQQYEVYRVEWQQL